MKYVWLIQFVHTFLLKQVEQNGIIKEQLSQVPEVKFTVYPERHCEQIEEFEQV